MYSRRLLTRWHRYGIYQHLLADAFIAAQLHFLESSTQLGHTSSPTMEQNISGRVRRCFEGTYVSTFKVLFKVVNCTYKLPYQLLRNQSSLSKATIMHYHTVEADRSQMTGRLAQGMFFAFFSLVWDVGATILCLLSLRRRADPRRMP